MYDGLASLDPIIVIIIVIVVIIIIVIVIIIIIFIVIVIVIVTPPPWECHLNWVPEDHPPPSRDQGKENLPPPEEPRKLLRKMRPCRKPRKHHHQHRIITGSQPGTSQSPSPVMSTTVKHPQTFQRPQHPQPPSSAANHNSGRPNLLDQAELGRLFKPTRSSISCFQLSLRSH